MNTANDNILKNAKEVLSRYFGYGDFREGQEKVIESILSGRDTVVVMPTGAGKSLCYQLPALCLEGVAIVVSPLISLMKDQVDDLLERNIPATFINSSISPVEMGRRMGEIREGKFKLVYIAPERFYSREFLAVMKEANISLFAVDEAHCISEWGHDFRPSYLKLKQAVESLGRPPVIALTATATPEVKEDIARQLGLSDAKMIVTGFDRKNLIYYVVQISDINSKQYKILDIAQKVGFPGIVYAGTRNTVEGLVEFLGFNGITALGYHAGMDDQERRRAQDDFMSGKADVIVATNAFGMGIDKPDIRFVAHFDMPGTLEAYYQEAGRAGRDGKRSYCVLLYHRADRHLRDFFIKGDNPPRGLIKGLYEMLKAQSGEPILMTYSEMMEQLNGMGVLRESVPEMAVGTALGILEKEGYLRRSNERAKSAYIRFFHEERKILESVSKRAKKQIEVLEALIKRFSGYLEQGINFTPAEIARDADMPMASLARSLRALKENGLIDYEPPFRGREIFLLKREDELDIDFTALLEKKKRDYGKLDRMEEYIYTPSCRRKYLLDYFGDESAANECEGCDICLGLVKKTAEEKELSRSPRQRSGWQKKPFHLPDGIDGADDIKVVKPGILNTKPTQFRTYELHKKGMSPDEIAQKRELGLSEIREHFKWLAAKGIKI